MTRKIREVLTKIYYKNKNVLKFEDTLIGRRLETKDAQRFAMALTYAGDIERIIEAALADPVQKYEAKWELGAEYEYAYCSHCGHQQWANWDSSHEAEESIGEFHKEYKFCPNCGFEMKGATDEQ
jgi:NADH pyrophosphatase NudC (nudix superfamily)